jgi:hypothetical protein
MLSDKEENDMKGKGYSLQDIDRLEATKKAFERGEYSKSGVHLSDKDIKAGKGVKRKFK